MAGANSAKGESWLIRRRPNCYPRHLLISHSHLLGQAPPLSGPLPQADYYRQTAPKNPEMGNIWPCLTGMCIIITASDIPKTPLRDHKDNPLTPPWHPPDTAHTHRKKIRSKIFFLNPHQNTLVVEPWRTNSAISSSHVLSISFSFESVPRENIHQSSIFTLIP